MLANLWITPLLVAFSAGQADEQAAHLIYLQDSLVPLQERFNAQPDRPQVLAIFSPT